MPDRVTAFQLQRQFGSTFQRVRGGETLIITYDGVDTAAILPISEHKRLETQVSEDQGPYATLPQDLDTHDLADELASIALARAQDDRRAARVALLQALMMLERD